MKYDAKRAKLERAEKHLRVALNNTMLSEDDAPGFHVEIREIKKELDDLINRIDWYINNWDTLKELDKKMGKEDII